MTFPADKTERRKISELMPYPRNPRTHSPEQIEVLVGMIKEFGFTQPILIDEHNMILAGHGRTMAAIKLGWSELPAIVLRGLTDPQKRAIVIADNRASELAGWDQTLLTLELGELKLLEYDLKLTGYSAEDLVTYVAAGDAAEALRQQNVGSLADRFGIPPFSVLNAREGWWQDRKRAWLALGIQSELGRGEAPIGGAPMPLDRAKANATPGGSKMPAADYSKNHARGDGRGRAVV